MPNPLIALQGKSFNPLEIDAQVAQVRGAEQNNLLNSLKMDEYKRGVERQNKLAGLLSTGADAAGLLRGGFQKEGMDLAESNAKVAKARAEAEKDKLANAITKTGRLRQFISSAKDQQTYDWAVRAAQQEGHDVSDVPPQFDPAFVQHMGQEALTAEQRLEQIWKQRGYDLDVRKQGEAERHNKTSEGLTASGQALTRRGQDLVDNRARETTAAAMTKPFEVTGPDGLPMLVQQDRRGNLAPVQGFGPKSGASKPLTDSQGKANLFGSRMQESDRILTELDGQYSPAAVNAKMGAEKLPLVGGVAGYVANKLLTDGGQQADQAQRDFVNAVLRRESGAVITDAEFENAKKQYFPQPGDSDAVKAQKRRNRTIAIEGILAEVPEGRRGVPSLKTPGGVQAKPDAAGGAYADADKERRYQEFKARQGAK